MTVSANTTFDIEIASSWDAIASRWDTLAANATATPFQSGHWIGNWYRVFGSSPGVEPAIVCVRETASGRDVMMVPLIRRITRGVRQIEFADLWVTDYNAPLVHAGFDLDGVFEAKIWPDLLKKLPAADILNLAKMPKLLGSRANPLAQLAGAMDASMNGHIVSLPESWDAYVAMLSKDTRRAIKRRWQKFIERPNAGLRRVSTAEDGLAILETLNRQQTSRLASRGAKHVFDDPLYKSFYERSVVTGLAEGTTVLYALHDGDEVIATFLAIRRGDHVTLIRTSQSQDEAWKSFGLGKLIIFQSLEQLHAEGCRTFDLSIGAHRYKDDFRVEPVALVDLMQRLSWRALPFVAQQRTVAMVRRNPRLMAAARTFSATIFPRRPAAVET